MRMDLPTITRRSSVAVESGFGGVALMDHLAPPMAENQPMWDAMITAAWLGANTGGTVGHLVLCDSFRHPAVLARQAVTLDHATSGRFELGIGWGSVPTEFETFGIGDSAPRARVDRLTISSIRTRSSKHKRRAVLEPPLVGCLCSPVIKTGQLQPPVESAQSSGLSEISRREVGVER